MGCGSFSKIGVHPLTYDKDETGSTLGDSAVSKVTTDSGVVMENREILELPGAVPSKLPPLTSESIRESEADRVTNNAAAAGLLQQESPVRERPKSSDILKELFSHGIIPHERIREMGSGPAYSIMLDEKEGIMRRPPARLESLKAKKAQRFHKKEELEEKMRLVEERRKFKQDELKTRLRLKSAHVRGLAPISHHEEEDGSSISPLELLQWPPSSTDQAPDPKRQHRFLRKPAGRDVFSGELESDFSFQHPEDRDEIF